MAASFTRALAPSGSGRIETWLQTVVIFPNVDALDEFKLQTSTYSAEFGRSLGGVVNLQIKSGTNMMRGSVFEFHRNDALDANNFFNNRAGRPKPDFKQNQFGFTLGGPVFRDRTFFFGDYQGHREAQGQTFLSTVPSELMRQGNFSEINRVIYDPVTREPFPGNIIPQDRWDPPSRSVLQQLYPSANTTGTRGATGQTINNVSNVTSAMSQIVFQNGGSRNLGRPRTRRSSRPPPARPSSASISGCRQASLRLPAWIRRARPPARHDPSSTRTSVTAMRTTTT